MRAPRLASWSRGLARTSAATARTPAAARRCRGLAKPSAPMARVTRREHGRRRTRAGLRRGQRRRRWRCRLRAGSDPEGALRRLLRRYRRRVQAALVLGGVSDACDERLMFAHLPVRPSASGAGANASARVSVEVRRSCVDLPWCRWGVFSEFGHCSLRAIRGTFGVPGRFLGKSLAFRSRIAPRCLSSLPFRMFHLRLYLTTLRGVVLASGILRAVSPLPRMQPASCGFRGDLCAALQAPSVGLALQRLIDSAMTLGRSFRAACIGHPCLSRLPLARLPPAKTQLQA